MEVAFLGLILLLIRIHTSHGIRFFLVDKGTPRSFTESKYACSLHDATLLELWIEEDVKALDDFRKGRGLISGLVLNKFVWRKVTEFNL